MPSHKSISGKLRLRRPATVRKTRLARLGLFLNSSIGIWILSSVFISFGSWLFTVWTDERKAEMRVSETVKKLDTEIASRFYYKGIDVDFLAVGIRLYRGRDSIDKSQRDEIYNSVLSPPPKIRIMYPEYAERGLLSLMEELAGLIKGQDQRCVIKAMNTVRATMLRTPLMSTRADSTAEALARIKIVADFRWAKDAKVGRDIFEKFVRPKTGQQEPTECPTHYKQSYKDPMEAARVTGIKDAAE